MADFRDGTINLVLKKLRRLNYEIEETNRRFDTLDRTGDTLDDVRARIDHCESEMINLRRQVERGSALLPPQNQETGTDRLPIPCTLGNVAACLGF